MNDFAWTERDSFAARTRGDLPARSRGFASAKAGLVAGSETGQGEDFKQRVREILRHVPDPEIPCVSVVDLGIVREVRKDAVVITPTYTGCPATIAIQTAIRAALDRAGLEQMRIETALFPPWTTDWISDEGREKLHAYGIAPPQKGGDRHSLRDEPAECPRCGSQQTEEISRFGSTPCKALHRCLSCGEPFDRFKCH